MLRKAVAKIIIFTVIFAVVFVYVTNIIMPDYFYNQLWATTATYQGFYEMDENSVDVLFLGSSAPATAFIPQELYNNYGIVSYNISCEQQSMFTSYYWLKEALRFQNPKVVVLETSMLFDIYGQPQPLNSTEGCVRKAFESMKWSFVKEEAIDVICDIDKEQSKLSYYFPIIRYHTRWDQISKTDFNAYYLKMSSHHELKGWVPFSIYVNKSEYEPFDDISSNSYEEAVPLMQEYLDNIVQLCNENDIKLILVNTPQIRQTLKKYKTLERYSKKNELFFIDFNEKTIYEAVDYNFIVDNAEYSHVSYRGGVKLTNYIGKILTEQYKLEAKTSDAFEATKDYYEHIKTSCELPHIDDVDEYLENLKLVEDRYDVFISVRDEATRNLKESTIQRLKDLGFNADLKDKFQYSYIGIISKDEIIEKCENEKLEIYGFTVSYDVHYSVVSGGYNNGNTSSIIIDDVQYSPNRRGLNIVIYDDERNVVIDKVAFDTWSEENTAYR